MKIPKNKAAVFKIVRHFVALHATFWMTDNLIRAAYDVLTNPLLRACGEQVVASYIAVQCTADFHQILDILLRFWTFYISFDGSINQGMSYLDFWS